MKLQKSDSYDLFLRGKLIASNEIDLPQEWESVVDVKSITVCITPIGATQNIIVKRADSKKVYLQSSGIPIECYYHIYADKKKNEST